MNKQITTIIAALFMAFVLVLAGCSNDTEQNQEQPVKDEQQAEANSFPVTIKDATGNDITIDKKPERIVSLIPSNTEITYAVGAGDKVVGVTDWDNYPEETKDKETVGGLDFNSEKVVSLSPDLVLAHASSMTQSEQALEQLRQSGIKVVVIPDATSFERVYETIQLIGKATGHAEEAEKVIKDMKDQITAIKDKASQITDEERKKVWIEVSAAPDMYTTGKGTFMNEMIEMIGAENVAADQEGWIKFSEEDAVLLQPDVIVATYGYYTDGTIEQIKQRPAWKDVPAVKNDQIFTVDADKFNRAGPRLVEGVEELAKKIYPEIYK